MSTPDFPEITIGSEKQIAYATEKMTAYSTVKTPWEKEPRGYFNFYRKLDMIKNYRERIGGSSAPDALKSQALHLLDKAPSTAIFWIDCDDDTLAMAVEAVITGKRASQAAACRLAEALTKEA